MFSGVLPLRQFWRENNAFTEAYAMNTDTTFEMSTLRFEGERFKGHSLDVECTQELIAYRNLVLECAKSVWRIKYPNRSNLPRGFETPDIGLQCLTPEMIGTAARLKHHGRWEGQAHYN